jgi:hypothetical protein
VDEREAGGYSVAYCRDNVEFPVYALAAVAAVLIAIAFITGEALWLVPGIAAAGCTYYNLPLIDTERPALGANQYGVFIQALGLIHWRAIERIELVPIQERATTFHELQIVLGDPLDNALVADWRRQPFHRSLMRPPWRMRGNDVVRINVDPFDQPPHAIHETLVRMSRYYRS